MSNTVNCYRCGKEVEDKDSFNADHITKDGGSFCLMCYTIRENNA
jgi:hypothetical protein